MYEGHLQYKRIIARVPNKNFYNWNNFLFPQRKFINVSSTKRTMRYRGQGMSLLIE